MIAGLQGKLESLGSDWAIINVGGISFQVYMPTSTLSTLGTIGEEVQLHTHLHLREDNATLYGFASADELGLFQTLIGVSGLGPKLALAIGRAQAIALLAATGRGIPTYEYTPAQIKQRVANYGASSKEQIQEMVRLQLGLSEVPQPNDAADALAVAICHLREIHLSNLLASQ